MSEPIPDTASWCCGAPLKDHPSGQVCVCTNCGGEDDTFDG